MLILYPGLKFKFKDDTNPQAPQIYQVFSVNYETERWTLDSPRFDYRMSSTREWEVEKVA